MLSDGLIVVALQASDDEHLSRAAARLRQRLTSAIGADGSDAACAGTQVQAQVVDVAGQPDVEAAWQLLRVSVQP